jgi:hypothetical protein
VIFSNSHSNLFSFHVWQVKDSADKGYRLYGFQLFTKTLLQQALYLIISNLLPLPVITVCKKDLKQLKEKKDARGGDVIGGPGEDPYSIGIEKGKV